MDIQTLAALGEGIGGIAVLVTLVYLAFQIKQSNRIATAVAQQNIFLNMSALHRPALEPSIAELRLKMRTRSYDELDPVEAEQLEAHVYGLINVWAAVQAACDQGLITKEVLEIYIEDVSREMERYPATTGRFVNVWAKYPHLGQWPIYTAIKSASQAHSQRSEMV